MNQITRSILFAAFILAGLAAPAFADGPANLLANPTFDGDPGHQIPGWVFSTWILKDNPTIASLLDGTVDTDAGGHHKLTLTVSGTVHAIQIWWQSQNLPCAPGATYNLTGSIKGTVSGQSHPVVAVYFMDAAGKWLSYQDACPLHDIPADWQKSEGSVTAPENAAQMGVRLGLVVSDGQAQLSFKEPVLTLKSN